MNDILQFFPLAEARPKQIKALEFIRRKVEEGFTDIVIAAPTGAGKSAIGVAAAHWIASHEPPADHARGAYYLVTQKLLQDQITDDIPRYRDVCQNCASLKTAEEYPCGDYGDCATGLRVSAAAKRTDELPDDKKAKISAEQLAKKTRKCSCIIDGTCAYRLAKARWQKAALSITNYAYFFTAKAYTNDIKPRQMLLLDEAHSVEEQLIRFVDGAVSLSHVKKWTQWQTIPKFDTMDQYAGWVENEYLPKLGQVYQDLVDLESLADDNNLSKDVIDLDKYICKLNRAIAHLKKNPDNWVFWREESKDASDIQYVIRPVFGAPFVKSCIKSVAPIRLYLSAYPGIPSVFSHNLGLDTSKMAWATMSSDFPADRRRVHHYKAGSMGSASKVATLPHLLKMIVKVCDKHKDTRGLIHSNSYELGKQIQEALVEAGHGDRIIFPQSADDRELSFKTHSDTEGAILISPSMVEGFDFAGDRARWQVIAKVGYPYLGDKQTARKLELSPEWYQMRTVMTIIQACGRICRSATDYGTTYIFDSDFEKLWKKNEYMFPKWFKESVIFH